jgi:hypothetical protein
MSASYIPVIRKTLRSVTPEDAAVLADEVRALCCRAGADEIYAYVRKFLMKRLPDLKELQAFFAPSSGSQADLRALEEPQGDWM